MGFNFELRSIMSRYSVMCVMRKIMGLNSYLNLRWRDGTRKLLMKQLLMRFVTGLSIMHTPLF